MMKTKIKISVLASASLLFAAEITNAQSTAATNVYNAANFLGWGATSGDLPFKVNNSTKMTLQNTTGYFGIGTTSPLGMFHATAGNGAGSWAYFTGNVSSNNPSTSFAGGIALGYNVRGACEANIVSGPADCGTAGGFRFQNWAYGGGGTLTDLVTIIGNTGNTGIGTTTPASKLDVEGGLAVGATYSGTTAAPSNGAIIEGLVGIGTSSPSTGLHVKGAYPNGYATIERTGVNGATHAGVMTINSDAKTTGDGIVLGFGALNSSSAAKQYAQVRMAISSPTASSENGILEFWTTNAGTTAEKVRIDNAGNMGIGTTSPGYTLDVNGTAHCTSGLWSSDQQFKTDIDSIQNALAIIKQLKPKTYYFDTTNVWGLNFPSAKQHGFVAQDLEQVLPEIVATSSKPAEVDSSGNVVHPALTYKSVYYLELIAFLTKGIQEQQQKIDSLQSKANNQDSINSALQNQIITNNTMFQNQLNELQSSINKCCSSTRSMHIGSTDTQSQPAQQMNVKLRDVQSLVLQQNVPNPFKEQTTINYTLPETYMNAQLLFYNSQGKLIQTVELTGNGNGQLNVFADDLSMGIYTYTLVIDGKIIETKKMIKQ